MYTASVDQVITLKPTPEQIAAAEEKARLEKTISDMRWLLHNVSVTDFAGLSATGQKTELKNLHKSLKHKGGKPPRDYTLVEEWVDFQRAVAQGNWEEAVPLYYHIRRSLGHA